jgi:hypothetical protein
MGHQVVDSGDLVNPLKFGESFVFGHANPEPSPENREGVETEREARKGRDSPGHKPERGSESYSGKHNRPVLGSTPSGPTK